MKLRLTIATALLLASTSVQLVLGLEPQQRAFGIVRLKTPVALDGSASEWSAIPPTLLSGADGRASVRLGYDAANFYAFVEVVDASPVTQLRCPPAGDAQRR